MSAKIKRREFIMLCGSAAAWPLAAWAQQAKLPTIGFLGASTAADFSGWVALSSAWMGRPRGHNYAVHKTAGFRARAP